MHACHHSRKCCNRDIVGTDNAAGPRAVRAVAFALQYLPELESLDVSGNTCNGDTLRELLLGVWGYRRRMRRAVGQGAHSGSGIASLRKLRRLNCSYMEFAANDLSLIVECLDGLAPSLEFLDVRGNGCSDAAIAQCFAKCIELSRWDLLLSMCSCCSYLLNTAAVRRVTGWPDTVVNLMTVHQWVLHRTGNS